MKVTAFVQARVGSSRLPGKNLKKVLGKELLLHLVDRIRRAKTVSEVVVITSTSPQDNPIVKLCEENHVLYFRGSELDLLDRHYQAAREFRSDFALKIPSDAPLSDPDVIDQVVSLWLENQNLYDYVSNQHPPTFPDGLDVEGLTFSALEIAWKEAKKPYEREHTTPFIWDHPERFRIGNVLNNYGDIFLTHRWTLDYEKDFELIKIVFETFKDKPHFLMEDVLQLIKKKPEIREINKEYAGVNWYRHHAPELKTIKRHMYKKENPPTFEKSLQWLERTKKVIPCATQSLSKGYTQWSVGAAPLFIESAKGCEVYDVDGNSYIDYSMALGPCILGYADPDVNAAVQQQLELGTMFTLPHPLETKAAELIVDVVPCAEMVRFGKNGSDVTSAAVKAARAYTGKEKIITCGYHGWQDWYVAITERNKGIPKIMKEFILPMKYNDLESLEKIIFDNKGTIAGLIMEPITVEPPKENFLESIREITKREGIVLIFDEMFTGFRWSLGGAQEYFNITPDIACFGKAVANGFPVSVLAGKREFMQEFEDIFFSITYGGETLSLAAMLATIHKLKEKKVNDHIWSVGADLKKGIEALILKHDLSKFLSVTGHPVKTAFNFFEVEDSSPLEIKTYFQQECAKRGLLFIGYHLPSYAHKKEEIQFTLDVYDAVFESFKKVTQKGNLRKFLEGAVVTQIFKNVGDRSSGLTKKQS